jgi:hypothetical protein
VGADKAVPVWAKCYKNFYVCNLRMFAISLSVCPGISFQISLTFMGKAHS